MGWTEAGGRELEEQGTELMGVADQERGGAGPL